MRREGCAVVRHRALAMELVWAEFVNGVTVRINGLVLVEQRDVASLLVGTRRGANDRDLAREHKVLDETATQPQKALDHGDKALGGGRHVEGFAEAGRQQGRDHLAAERVGGNGSAGEEEVNGGVCDGDVAWGIHHVFPLICLSLLFFGWYGRNGICGC